MIMQITAFKAILARRINIKGCEDYKKIIKILSHEWSLIARRDSALKLLCKAFRTLSSQICFCIFKHFEIATKKVY